MHYYAASIFLLSYVSLQLIKFHIILITPSHDEVWMYSNIYSCKKLFWTYFLYIYNYIHI